MVPRVKIGLKKQKYIYICLDVTITVFDEANCPPRVQVDLKNHRTFHLSYEVVCQISKGLPDKQNGFVRNALGYEQLTSCSK